MFHQDQTFAQRSGPGRTLLFVLGVRECGHCVSAAILNRRPQMRLLSEGPRFHILPQTELILCRPAESVMGFLPQAGGTWRREGGGVRWKADIRGYEGGAEGGGGASGGYLVFADRCIHRPGQRAPPYRSRSSRRNLSIAGWRDFL